ncbi:transposon Tf2-6 polyprotein [Trichonephila clavipes]|nr:transposon Tf2-6 polyprotein [Trichonephila clavipes]
MDLRECIDYRKLNQKLVKDKFPLPLIEDVLDTLQEAKCALWAGGIIGPYFFKNDEGHNVTVNGDRYRAMITNFFIPELNNHDVQELWFQQDGATCHTARATIDLLKDTFGDRLISRFGPVNWPPISCDLTPLDYFLWGYVKSLFYADKPQTLDHLEDNIRRVIADIRPQMLEKVIENWTSRLDYIRASRGSPMPEIIFKISIPLKKTPFTLDLRNSLFHVDVDEDCRKYTSFIVPDGQFEFNKVPFGLRTRPGVFQRYVSSIFRDLTRKGIVISYLDDLVIPAKNEQKSLEKLKTIFEVAKKYGLEIKFKKGQFLKKKIEFLGHIVESGTIKPSPTKTHCCPKISRTNNNKTRQHFKIVTDCSAFQKTMQNELIIRISRWVLQLEEFDYEIEHRAGSRMKHVDALSRYPVMIVCNDTLTSKLKKAQEEDDNIQTLKLLLEKQESEEFFERNGILYKYLNGRELIVTAKAMEAELIKVIHENGHFSVGKTEDCETGVFLSQIYPTSVKKRIYQIFTWLYPVKTVSAESALEKLKQQQKTFGNPIRIISDRGSASTSKLFNDYCDAENIQHLQIATGVPRGNGQFERIHRTLIPVLTKLSLDDSTKWYKYVDRLQRILNSTICLLIMTLEL